MMKRKEIKRNWNNDSANLLVWQKYYFGWNKLIEQNMIWTEVETRICTTKMDWGKNLKLNNCNNLGENTITTRQITKLLA